MSMILSLEYGQEMIKYLGPCELWTLFHTDKYLHDYLQSKDVIGSHDSFESYLCNFTRRSIILDDRWRSCPLIEYQRTLIVCVEINAIAAFSLLLEIMFVDKNEVKEDSHMYSCLNKIAYSCVDFSRRKLIDIVLPYIYKVYDWKYCSSPNDYTRDYMEYAVKTNRPSMVKHLLTRQLEYVNPKCNEVDRRKKLLWWGMNAAREYHNRDAMLFFIKYSTDEVKLYMDGPQTLLELDDDDLYDQYIDQVSFLNCWCNSEWSVITGLGVTIQNNNRYLADKVIELVRSYGSEKNILMRARRLFDEHFI